MRVDIDQLAVALDGLSERVGKKDDFYFLSSRAEIVDSQVVFGFKGTDEGQADLLSGLIQMGIRMRSFEEKRSSFEDILVGIAEGNRRS